MQYTYARVWEHSGSSIKESIKELDTESGQITRWGYSWEYRQG